MAVLVNGFPDDRVGCQDRGLHFGDGVFETIAVLSGELKHWNYHMQRLRKGCQRLAISPPDTDRMRHECRRLIGDTKRLVIKIIVTRGSGGKGYGYSKESSPTRIILTKPWSDASVDTLVKGVKVGFSDIDMHGHPLLAGIKHLNAIEQVLASRECVEKGWDECLRSDAEGNIIEGYKSNLFVVKNHQLFTADLSKQGVAGIMRRVVLEKAEEMGVIVKERTLKKEDILQADELFFTNSLIGIWPVIEVSGQRFFIGSLTKKMMQWLALEEYYRIS